MDAFFASVEQHDRPELAQLPVIVGGSRERGVVCACSYQTRPYGVRSGMAISKALARCPQALVLPVRMARYQQVSRQVFRIFADFSDLVEPLSIDEAFIDVSGCRRLLGSGTNIAAQIRERISHELGLPVSAGVAPNKFLAKLASDEAKPDGLLEVTAEQVDAFLLPLEVGKIWGVGRVMLEKLTGMGIRTVADLRACPRSLLSQRFGSAGDKLYALARGEDDRAVCPARAPKSIGAEETFSRDLCDVSLLKRQLLALAERIARRARAQQLVAGGLTLKVKYADFCSVTRSAAFSPPEQDGGVIAGLGGRLLEKTEAGQRPVRLLGLSLTGLRRPDLGQQDLFADPGKERRQRLTGALDELYERYGQGGVKRATLLSRDGSVQRSEQGNDGSE